MHDDEANNCEDDDPMGQALHVSDPVVFVKYPGSQSVHLPPAVGFLYPAEQGVHDAAPDEDDDPIGQGVHTLLFG